MLFLCLRPEGDALTPSKVVEMLDRFIVGQSEAKKAVAVALRKQPLLSAPLVCQRRKFGQDVSNRVENFQIGETQ